jgi:hypothetical protein
VFKQNKILWMVFAWCAACGRGESRLEGSDEGLLTQGSVCSRAVDRLVNACAVPSQNIPYDGQCDAYSECEAECLNDVDCRAYGFVSRKLDEEDMREERYDYAMCSRSCYANGPATCAQAGLKAQACGVSWSLASGACIEEHGCIANCIMAVPCSGLTGSNSEMKGFYQSCVAKCQNVPSPYNPSSFSGSGFWGYNYCNLFPMSLGC